MKKRIISALLAAVMLIAMVPTAAFAENESENKIHVNPSYEGNDSDGTSDKPYATLAEAIEAAKPGDTIVLAAGEYDLSAFNEKWHTSGKVVNIVGAGAETTTLNGSLWLGAQNQQAVTDIESLNISGVTFENTNGSEHWSNVGLGFTEIDDCNITVSDSKFVGFQHGVHMNNSSGTTINFENVEFADNDVAMSAHVFTENEKTSGFGTINATVENCAFAVQAFGDNGDNYYKTIADFKNNKNGVAGENVEFASDEASLKSAVTTEGAYIVLTSDIEVSSKITVNENITIDGSGHTIKASDSWSGTANTDKHLLGIEGSAAAGTTVKDIILDSNSRAFGFQPYDVNDTVYLSNVILKNSKGTGMTVNGSSVVADNLTVSGSGWGQSIDVSNGVGIEGSPMLTLTNSDLQDSVGIFEDIGENAEPNGAVVVVDGETYAPHKNETLEKWIYLADMPVKIGENGYWTLADAVEAVGTDGIGTEIVLTSDITLTETVTIDKSVTIDLGGNTVEYTGNDTYAIEINNANVVINDSSENGGKIVAEKRVIKVGDATIRTTGNPASLVLNGGTLESKDTEGEHCTIAVYANSTAARDENSAVACTVEINNATAKGGVYLFGEGAKVTVNDGAVIDTSGYYGISGNGTKTDSQNNGGTVIDINGGTITQKGVGGGAIYHPQDGTLDISGNAVIKGDSGIQMCSGESVIANITGGTITATGEDQREGKTGDGFIPDGAAVSVVNRNYPGGIPKMTISGGSFVSEKSKAVMAYTWKDNEASDWAEANQYLTITGGTFSADPTKYVASGYSVKESGGKYTVYYPSTGGGTTTPSNPGETVTNPDGSTTTTVTKPDGTVTETTKQPDGSTTVTTTKPDGSSVTTVDNKDGSSSKTTVSAEGKTESYVKLPSAVVDNAEKNGEAVELPIPEVTASKDADKAPKVTVDLPAGRSAKVEIPVDNVNAGVVAVLVHADGTEEIIKTSVPTENGIEVKVEDGATLKIVDNSKDFADVAESHWGADAVDFAVSREIFDGTSETTFEPETAMTRAMVVTVLARLDGVDTAGDVWYEAGAEWAKENGISDGTNLNAMVSREQLVTMLYRYAGSPEVEGQLAGYPDAESVSGYAEKAMIWAVENGIITGADGKIAPQGDATRVQVAAILMRFIDLMQ